MGSIMSRRKALTDVEQGVRDYLLSFPERQGGLQSVHDLNDLRLPWAAGLFDGEGCIVLTERRISLRIVMTHAETIRAFGEVVWVPSYFERATHNPRHKSQYGWQASARPDVYQVLIMLTPHMITKRQLAEEALREVQWRMFWRQCNPPRAPRPARPPDLFP